MFDIYMTYFSLKIYITFRSGSNLELKKLKIRKDFILMTFFTKNVKQTSLKKSIEVHFDRSKILYCIFTTHVTSVREKKIIHAKYSLFMRNKCLYRIS